PEIDTQKNNENDFGEVNKSILYNKVDSRQLLFLPFDDIRAAVRNFDPFGKRTNMDLPTESIAFDPKKASEEWTESVKDMRTIYRISLMELSLAIRDLSLFDGDFTSLVMLPLQAIVKCFLNNESASVLVPFREDWLTPETGYFSETNFKLTFGNPDVLEITNSAFNLQDTINTPLYRFQLRSKHTSKEMFFGIDIILEMVREMQDGLRIPSRIRPIRNARTHFRRLFYLLWQLENYGELIDRNNL
ncbi:unnamed protein product, partial [marine sediment metagenome]